MFHSCPLLGNYFHFLSQWILSINQFELISSSTVYGFAQVDNSLNVYLSSHYENCIKESEGSGIIQNRKYLIFLIFTLRSAYCTLIVLQWVVVFVWLQGDFLWCYKHFIHLPSALTSSGLFILAQLEALQRFLLLCDIGRDLILLNTFFDPAINWTAISQKRYLV